MKFVLIKFILHICIYFFKSKSTPKDFIEKLWNPKSFPMKPNESKFMWGF